MGIRSSVMNFLGFGKPPARVFRRAYSGAMVSRLTSDWMSTQASADAEIRGNLRRLRDRSREMVRNNPYARQAKRTTQINVCLLYTSPSPRDYAASRMPSSA